MEKIWGQVEEFRAKYESTRDGHLPVDVFSLVEIDLRLNIIPFPGLTERFKVWAALRADFSGIYVDQETHYDLEAGEEWKLKRLRFSLAHELGHFVLHRKLPQEKHFSGLTEFANWTRSYEGKRDRIEREADEFAGRLLVPLDRLTQYYDDFMSSEFAASVHLTLKARELFAEHVANKFGVNRQVIEIRLDREGLWPAN